MPTTPEKNASILHTLAEHGDRFVLAGSLARGILLGHDVADLHDPHGNRFQDVDAIDRSTLLTDEYAYLDGHLGAGITKVIRPTTETSTWGFYDNQEPVSPSTEPISTFDVSQLGLEHRQFSRLYPEDTIAVPSPRAMLYLSNFFAYAQPMPKHQTQIRGIAELAGPETPELDSAYTEFIRRMSERYPLTTYTRARRMFFSYAPGFALAAQQAIVGPIVRRIRGVQLVSHEPLSEIKPIDQV